MVNDGVETTGETGEGHPGFCTVNEEAGHIVLRVEHVEHDMGKRTMTTITNEETGREVTDSTECKRDDTNGEQTEGVIKTEHLGEGLLAQCTRSDEVAGSVVLHVSSDMNEKEKHDEEADETAAAKRDRGDVKGRRGNQKTHRGERKHTQRSETVSERSEQTHKNASGAKKNEKTARHPTNTRRLQRSKEHPRNQICKEKNAHHQERKERQIFNGIIKQHEKKVRVKVIHKKGDVEDVRNYHPICSLLALDKLFTTKLYSRLYPRLDRIQPPLSVWNIFAFN